MTWLLSQAMLREWESHSNCPVFIERLIYDMGTRTRLKDTRTLQARLNRLGFAYIRSACEFAVSHQGPKNACLQWNGRSSTGPPLLLRLVYSKLSTAAYLGIRLLCHRLLPKVLM